MSGKNITHKFIPKRDYHNKLDKVVEEFYRPALAGGCILYQRATGYFSSTSFVYVINEILEFIERRGRIQLVTSPNLSRTDKEMMEKCIQDPEKILSEIFFDDLKNDPDGLKMDTAKLLGYMLAEKIDGRPILEIKIHVGPALFHEKKCIMQLSFKWSKINYSPIK